MLSNELRVGFRVHHKVVRPNEGYIEDSAGQVSVEPKFMDVLVCLAEHAGEVVDRDTLVQSVWRSAVVSDDSVNRSISQLRNYLGDDSRSPTFIETVPKRGYRLVSPVRAIGVEDNAGALTAPQDNNASSDSTSITPRRRRVVAQLIVGVVAGVVAAVITITVFLPKISSEPKTGRDEFNPPPRTIAVMPFQDKNSTSITTYLGDGIAEDLLSALSSMDDILVIARSSSFAFRDAETDVQTIGRALNVSALLQGSVWHSGDRIRLTAGLVDTTSGYQIWSKSFEQDASEIFAIQEEITRAVARELDTEYDLPNQLIVATASEFEAYDLYLLGHHNLIKRTPESLREAVRLFVHATNIDSEYGLAWAGLLKAYVFQKLYAGLSADDTQLLAAEALSKSLQYGEHLHQTHAARSLYYSYVAGDLEASRAAHGRAMEIAPDDALSMRRIAVGYEDEGQPLLGLEILDRAIRLDPLNQHIRIYRISTLMQLGRSDEAMVAFDDGPWIGSPNASTLRTTASWIGAYGNPLEGLDYAQKALGLDPDGPITIGVLIQLHLQIGNLDEANNYLVKGMQHSPDDLSLFAWQAKLAYVANDVDKFVQLTSAHLDATRPGSDRAISYSYLWGLYYHGLANLVAGEYQIAISHLDEWYQHYLNQTLSVPVMSTLEVMSYLAASYKRAGAHEKARLVTAAALQLADQVSKGGRADPLFIHIRAGLFALNGDVEKAVELLQETLTRGPTSGRRGNTKGFWSVKIDPTLDNLRDDERFQHLLDQIENQTNEMREAL